MREWRFIQVYFIFYHRFLKKNRLVNEKMALNIILNVLEGFYELLKYRIIHRDLKPANILIHNNTYKLAGFFIF